ncbi:MAG: LysR substrate-binding domain-containing protein, partial [Candidatus Binatia bacterium]
EEELGSTLFARQGRRVALSQAGNVLLPYARQVLRKVEEARAVISDFENMGCGRLTIGAGGAVCNHILPELLREFSSRYAKIEVQVISGLTVSTLQRTVDGTVDLGLLVLPVQQGGIQTTDLGRDELLAIAPHGHRWQQQARVTARDFLGEPLIIFDRGSHTFRILERFLLEAGVFPSIAMEISDLEAVKSMVGSGLGVSVVPRWSIRKELDTETVVAKPLGTAGLFRKWGLVRRTNEPLTASQRAFVSICKSRLPALIA